MHKKQEKLCGFTGNVDIVQMCVCEHPMLMHAFPGKCMYEECWCRNWQLKVDKTPEQHDAMVREALKSLEKANSNIPKEGRIWKSK